MCMIKSYFARDVPWRPINDIRCKAEEGLIVGGVLTMISVPKYIFLSAHIGIGECNCP